MNKTRTTTAKIGGLLALALAQLAWGGAMEIEFDGANFGAPTTITNDFWGLRLGGPTSATYFSEAEDGCEVSESTVMGTTGTGFFSAPYDVDALVIHDREWESEDCDGNYELVEDTFDWFAQDDDGNVWYLGEDTTALEELEAGGYCLSDAGSWKAGDMDAVPGVILPGDPQAGDAYQQEYLEDEAEDWGKVLRLNATVEIEFAGGSVYEGCAQTKEYTPLEPGSTEHKFYCRLSQSGVGLTLVNELHGKTRRVEYVGPTKPAANYGEFPAGLPSCDD